MDPLGRLVISDGRAQIVIECTYLDSWLAALIEALHRLPTMRHVRTETEEPKPIQIDMTADGTLVISYEDQRVVAKGLKELELALRAAVGLFFEGIRDTPDISQNRLLDPIRKFWVTTPN